MSDATTPAAPAPDISGLSQDQINQLLASLHLGQGLPNVQPDQTPVDSSGFGGGLRRVVSLLGEFAGSPGPETLKALSPAEREQAGIQALSRFGTGLLQASGSGQWIGTNLGNAFATAERGYDTTTKQALGMLAAKQGYAVEDQKAQLERLKAALPLLSLKQKLDAIQGLPATLGGTVAPGSNIATGGSIAPFVAKNLPEGVTPAEDQIVRTVLGEAGNQPLTGQQGVAAVIKNRMEAGKQNAQDVIFAANQFEPWNNAKTRADLEKIDPTSKQYQDVLNNAVRPVMSGSAKDPTGGATHFWSPTAQAALGREPPSWATGQTPTVIGQHNFYKLPYGAARGPAAPAQTATAPAMAPVGTTPPNTPVTIPPPPGAGAGARPALPPPEAPLAPGAGGAQTAGPGAPTANVIPPSPPGSPAAVADIISGMVARGADPTTLAPGQGSAPAPMPGAVVTAQAGPPPDSFEAYKLLHPITPDDTQRSLFNPQPDVTQLQRLDEQKRSAQQHYEQLYQDAKRGVDPAAAAKVREDYAVANQAIIDKENTLRENARKLGVETQAKYLAEQEKQRFDAWAAEQTDRRAQAAARQKQADELARINVTAEQTRSTNRDQVKNNASQKLQEDMNKETLAARERIGSLEAVLELSRNVQNPTLLANKTIGGTPVVDLIKGLGIGTESLQNRASAIQALRSGIANVTKAMRQGVALGNASDADLRFITALGPSEMEDDATREAIVANLLGQQHRQMRFGIEVSKMLSKGVDIGDAIDAVDKKIPPVTPVFPKELADAPRGDPRVAEWFSDNVPVNTIWSDAKGKRHILHTPDWKPPIGRQQP